MQRKSQLEFNTQLSIHSKVSGLRHNKIICTIGPSTQSVEALLGLMKGGMAVARMNFSHGTYEYHTTTINNVRQAAKELNMRIAIALDTKGPEIRCGMFSDPKGAVLNANGTVIVTTDKAFEDCGNSEKFFVDYPRLTKVVKVGGHIFIDDGVLNLEVLEILSETEVRCVIHNNHVLTNRKGVNLPMANVDLPAVSDRDRNDLAFGVEKGVDFIFASFIRTPEQVAEVRRALGERGKDISVISKIENHQGCDNIDAIINASDGIMVARGDLGVEIPAEKVVIAQKMIISKCNIVGKPVICATQMLESMTTNPRPTRAEVSDVANAVLDGADCVMLSGETAKGKYPNEVVEYMARICLETQNATWNQAVFEAVKAAQLLPMAPEEAICASAVHSIAELGAKAMIVLSNTGRSAQLLSKYRPSVPIFAVTQNDKMSRQLNLVRGVFPVFYETNILGEDLDREKRVWLGITVAKEMCVVVQGDLIVAVHADQKTKGFANQTRAIYVM